MAVFTAVTQSDLAQWLDHYALGQVVDFQGITSGIENSNFFLTTTQGEYVLTLFEQLNATQLPFYLELMRHLAAHGIPFQVVPGITAASGCAAYAGIPLTHRDYAQSVRFITGHLKDGTSDLPWSDLVGPSQTLVFYMGLIGLPIICEQLIQHGRSADTPAALIQQGTTSNQRVFTGTLADLPRMVAEHEVHAPTLVIVGEVVLLREKLKWFEGAQSQV